MSEIPQRAAETVTRNPTDRQTEVCRGGRATYRRLTTGLWRGGREEKGGRARRWLIRRKECGGIRRWLEIDQIADRVGGMRRFEVFSGVKTVILAS